MAKLTTRSRSEPPATAGSLYRVRLFHPHTHAGTDHVPGSEILVTAPERDWLAAQGVIEATPPQPTDTQE